MHVEYASVRLILKKTRMYLTSLLHWISDTKSLWYGDVMFSVKPEKEFFGFFNMAGVFENLC